MGKAEAIVYLRMRGPEESDMRIFHTRITMLTIVPLCSEKEGQIQLQFVLSLIFIFRESKTRFIKELENSNHPT